MMNEETNHEQGAARLVEIEKDAPGMLELFRNDIIQHFGKALPNTVNVDDCADEVRIMLGTLSMHLRNDDMVCDGERADEDNTAVMITLHTALQYYIAAQYAKTSSEMAKDMAHADNNVRLFKTLVVFNTFMRDRLDELLKAFEYIFSNTMVLLIDKERKRFDA